MNSKSKSNRGCKQQQETPAGRLKVACAQSLNAQERTSILWDAQAQHKLCVLFCAARTLFAQLEQNSLAFRALLLPAQRKSENESSWEEEVERKEEREKERKEQWR